MVWRLGLPMMAILFHGSLVMDREDQVSNLFIMIVISRYSKIKIPSKGKNLGELILKEGPRLLR
jgi:hypothetical protein